MPAAIDPAKDAVPHFRLDRIKRAALAHLHASRAGEMVPKFHEDGLMVVRAGGQAGVSHGYGTTMTCSFDGTLVPQAFCARTRT